MIMQEIRIKDFRRISRKSVWILDLNEKEHIIPEKAFTIVDLGVCAIDEYWIKRLGINDRIRENKS
jgi:hypothetical protein